jgi:hypothetical protein
MYEGRLVRKVRSRLMRLLVAMNLSKLGQGKRSTDQPALSKYAVIASSFTSLWAAR